MKIIINAYSAKLGGGQTYLRNLFENMPSNNELSVVVYAPKSFKFATNENLVRKFTWWPTNNPFLRAVWERLFLPIILFRESADVLFCPGGTVNTVAPKKCKTVTMFRNMSPFDDQIKNSLPFGMAKFRLSLLSKIMLRSMEKADLTIFISDFARNFIEKKINLKSAITIPHGLSSEFRTYSKVIPVSRHAPTSKYLLYVSRFDVYKHHFQIVRAYALLDKALRDEYSLVFVGETDSTEARRVLHLIRSENLGQNIFVLGALPYSELPALYHSASIILFASSCENCPNILLESLGAGRPILSSNIMPMPEFGGDAVEYCSPTDSQDIKRGLERLLTDDSRQKELASAAGIRSEAFRWEITAKRTWDAITSTLN